MPNSSGRLITLTTDFGLKDYYVGAMKAVILNQTPGVQLVDISHEIPPQDIMAGAWVLRNSAFLFPANTVHLAVVDPGVGTERKPIAARIDNHFFVGPDNGLFSLIQGEIGEEIEAVNLDNPEYWRSETSQTFHGRDIFAPVAAHLADGVPLQELGSPVEELVSYRWAMPIADKDGIQGWIVHIDHYGNLITNISRDLLEEVIDHEGCKVYIGNTIIDGLKPTFGAVEEGEPVAYIGSSDMLEIAINQGNAHQMLGVKKGANVSVLLKQKA
jgi:S-adenosylmethionine hydrolase